MFLPPTTHTLRAACPLMSCQHMTATFSRKKIWASSSANGDYEVTLELVHGRQKQPCCCDLPLLPFSPNLHLPLFSVCSGCLDFERQVEVKFRLVPVCAQRFGKGNWTEIQLLSVQVWQYFPGPGRKD